MVAINLEISVGSEWRTLWLGGEDARSVLRQIVAISTFFKTPLDPKLKTWLTAVVNGWEGELKFLRKITLETVLDDKFYRKVGFGPVGSRILAMRYKTLAEFFKAKPDDLLAVRGIGYVRIAFALGAQHRLRIAYEMEHRKDK